MAKVVPKQKNRYIQTTWFETAYEADLKKETNEQYLKLQIQFNSYGVINQRQFFESNYKKVMGILQNYSNPLMQFRFKFVGWQDINPLPFLMAIKKNIKAKSIYLNLSNLKGNKKLFATVINQFFKYQKYNTLSLNFSNWKQNYQTLKQLLHKVIFNDALKLILDFTGWGKNINQFFGLKQPNKQTKQYQVYLKEKQRYLKQFHQSFSSYFLSQLTASVIQQLRLDMRGWHQEFRLIDIKSELDRYLKQGTQMQSVMAMSKQNNKKPVFKFIFMI